MNLAIGLESDLDFFAFGPRHREYLTARFPDIAIVEVPGTDDGADALRSAEVFFGWRFRPAWFAVASRLRWIASPAAGTDHLPLEEAARCGVVVSRSFGFHATPMAEHVLGLVLGFARGLFVSAARQRTDRWWKPVIAREFFDLSGSVMVIVGCGAVGCELARLAATFGVTVLGVRRHPPAPGALRSVDAPPIARWYGPADVDDALRQARIVVNLLPAAPDTAEFFDARRFRAMAPGTVFINVGRGSTVDQPALLEALQAGTVGWCGLDVTQQRPPRMDDPLRHHPRVVLTPKSAVFRRDYMDRAIAFFADEVYRYRCGQPPLGVAVAERFDIA